MRIAFLLTGGALALAVPALAQTTTSTGQRTPMTAPTPAATPTPAPMTPDTAGTPAATQTTPQTAPTTPATPDAAATPAAPATPATPIGPSVGATVYGAAGAPVGTIKAMDAEFVTLTTAKGEVRLPAAGVGPGLKGPVIGLTAEQLDAAVTQAQAAQPATTETKTTTTTKTKKKAR